MSILITGGAGYIGSHTALELLNDGYSVVVYDNLCNSSRESLKRVEELTGKKITFYEGDILDEEALKVMFAAYRSSDPLCGTEGGWRIGKEAVGILPE